ncbi:TonB-dependent receptor [uncultured Zhongshania sp.]|jgi:outer membrane receptor protein involved in Fe transport|uniref:TonB-dependent receptor n=1 Tax=uncultured Zhongshania sp. TaxID=1642288 RepID=UPI0025FAA8C3|nr:TonB-dependent receptor [uncultured Zhongshania sp.]
MKIIKSLTVFVLVCQANFVHGAESSANDKPIADAAVAKKGGAAKSGMLEEILVTARKRSENIQETPVAITAFSGDALRAQGILTAQDLAKSVPSLQINDSTAPQIFIRGIGQRAGLARFDPSVSVYLDGIFIPRPDGQLLDTIDIESVQVLRGPQGTLFGKNNTGGALVFSLVKPGGEGNDYVEGALGSYSEQRFRAGFDIPITDKLNSRLAISSQRRDGFLHDISGAENQSLDRLSFIFQTDWMLSDSVSIDSLAYFGKIRERYPSYHCKIVNDDALFVNGLGILWAGDTDPSNPTAYKDNCNANSRDALKDLNTNQGDSQRQKKAQDVMLLASTLNWQISEDYNLKAILGYRDATKIGPQTQADEGGPKSYFRGMVLGDNEQESLTAELQLNGSAFDGGVDFTTGLFVQSEFKSETFLTSNELIGAEAVPFIALAAGQSGVDVSALNGLLDALSVPGGTLPVVAGALPVSTLQDFEIEGETYAIFSQATWHITDNLEFTFGGRYTEEVRRSDLFTQTANLEEISSVISAANPRFVPVLPSLGAFAYLGSWAEDPIQIANDILRNAYPGEIGAPLNPAVKDELDSVFREFTPMTSLAWVIPEQWLFDSPVNSMMMYGTWSNGFKSGFQEPFGVDGLIEVAPERLENREIGLKIDAFDNSLRLNIALYSMIFENMQLITVSVDSANTLVVSSQNAGESMIEGGELELLWLPTENLMFSFNYSNNNYRFIEFDDFDLAELALKGQKVAVDRSDEDFAVSPEVTAAFGAQYTFITRNSVFTPRLDVSYKSEVYMGLDDASWDVAKRDPGSIYAKATTLVDARFSWFMPDRDLTISAYIKNLTDKRYDIGAVATASSLGTYVQVLGEPRMFGIEARQTF